MSCANDQESLCRSPLRWLFAHEADEESQEDVLHKFREWCVKRARVRPSARPSGKRLVVSDVDESAAIKGGDNPAARKRASRLSRGLFASVVRNPPASSAPLCTTNECGRDPLASKPSPRKTPFPRFSCDPLDATMVGAAQDPSPSPRNSPFDCTVGAPRPQHADRAASAQ